MTDPTTLVPLIAPWGQGGSSGAAIITRAPRYLRGGPTSLWHRPRSGVRHPDGRPSLALWCGQTVTDARCVISADVPPPGEPACGTCEGRALGAGVDDHDLPADLKFTPAPLRQPRWCPAGGRDDRHRNIPDGRGWPRNGICAMCGSVERITARRGPYASGAVLARHRPAGPLTTCPFHGYRDLHMRNGTLACQSWRCGYQP